MSNGRRNFIKKTLGTSSAIVAAGVVTPALAQTKKQTSQSNGVVVGTSPKKEVLYKETQAWDDYFRASF